MHQQTFAKSHSSSYEEVYLHAYDTVSAAQQGLARHLMFYNQTRPHQALDGRTPDQVYSDHPDDTADRRVVSNPPGAT